ncbi:PepSY1/2 domain-containing protein [Gracilibacillus sp. JCM 18860]|uniref:PepSY1/2 domain-containing protein n=1 Tax=Gracilibacillus sp. JCM 18860 TaxID=1306159 RepID=UPI00326074C0
MLLLLETGATVPLYSGSYQKNNQSGYIDITQNGGHPLTMMINREVTEAKIGLNKATQLAEQYLQDLDFEELALLESNQYDNVGGLSFYSSSR